MREKHTIFTIYHDHPVLHPQPRSDPKQPHHSHSDFDDPCSLYNQRLPIAAIPTALHNRSPRPVSDHIHIRRSLFSWLPLSISIVLFALYELPSIILSYIICPDAGVQALLTPFVHCLLFIHLSGWGRRISTATHNHLCFFVSDEPVIVSPRLPQASSAAPLLHYSTRPTFLSPCHTRPNSTTVHTPGCRSRE